MTNTLRLEIESNTRPDVAVEVVFRGVPEDETLEAIRALLGMIEGAGRVGGFARPSSPTEPYTEPETTGGMGEGRAVGP